MAPKSTGRGPGEPLSVQRSLYLINIRAGDPVPCVSIRAGATLEAIPGVCTSDPSEARVGVTAACWASWGCRRSDGHQCVWGWGLKAQRTWKTRPVQSIGLLIHVEYIRYKTKFGFLTDSPTPSHSHRFLRRTTRSYSRAAVLEILSLHRPIRNAPVTTEALTTSLAFSDSISQK